jgi:hypothetical protein
MFRRRGPVERTPADCPRASFWTWDYPGRAVLPLNGYRAVIFRDGPPRSQPISVVSSFEENACAMRPSPTFWPSASSAALLRLYHFHDHSFF